MGADATIEVGWDNSAARAGAEEFKRHASSAANHATSALNGAGAAVGGTFRALAAPIIGLASIEGVSRLVEEFSQLNDVALRLNENTDVVQRVTQSAGDNSTDIDTVAASMEKMMKVLSEGGTEDAQKGLKELGVSARDFAGMNLEEKLVAVGQGLIKMREEGEDTSGLWQLMGKGAGKMIPMLLEIGANGKAGFEGMTVATKDTIAQMDAIGDKAGQMMQKVKVGAVAALPFLNDMMSVIMEMGETKQNREERLAAPPKPAPVTKTAEEEKASRLAAYDREQADKFNERQKKEAIEIIGLKEKLSEETQKMMEATLSDLEKEEAARNRLADLQREIQGLAGPGQEVNTLKLETERVKVLGQIHALHEKNIKAVDDEAKKHRDADRALANKLEKEVALEAKRRGGFAELAAQTHILELQAGGHHKKAAAAQKELDIAMRAKQLVESMRMSEGDALKQAKHESDLQDKIDNPGKIRGHKDTRDHKSTFRGLDAMQEMRSRQSDFEKLQTNESAFQKMQRGPSPLDALNQRNNQPAKPAGMPNPNAKLEDTLTAILGFMKEAAAE